MDYKITGNTCGEIARMKSDIFAGYLKECGEKGFTLTIKPNAERTAFQFISDIPEDFENDVLKSYLKEKFN